jgi:hypothetical protein
MKNIIEGLILLAREAIMSSRQALDRAEPMTRVYGPMENLRIAFRGLLEIKPKEKVLNSYIEQCMGDVIKKIKELEGAEYAAGMNAILTDWDGRLDVIERNILANRIKRMK